MTKIGVIILAAGRGTRMNSTNLNKVTLPLGEKSMIRHTVERLENLEFEAIVVVIGFAKESVIQSLKGTKAIFAEQSEPQGTGHAVVCGLSKVPPEVEHVLVMNGDDSAFYTKDIFEKLISTHLLNEADITLLTIEKENPFGLGRIIRNENGKLIDIIEEKNATEEVKLINEVNPGCYIFRVSILNKYKDKIQKNKKIGEYYINNFIELSVRDGYKIVTLRELSILWHGVNTKDELKKAQELYLKTGKFE